MPFNINEFKSTMNKYGGPARKNIFVMEIANAPEFNDGMSLRDLRFFCQTISAPGVNVNVADYYPNGFGVKQSVPIGINQGPFNAVFMLDSDHMVLRFFHQWMQSVINYNFSRGGYSEVSGQLPYEVGYKKDISTRVTIKQYSTDSQDAYYEYVLDGVFPTEVSGVDLAWSDNDSYATVTVNFAYSHMETSGLRPGSPTARGSRGNGYLDLINSVGLPGQVINQGRLPTSIQDAVNALTSFNSGLARINTGFSQIKTGLRSIGNIL
jgi:hypothetical protein